MTSDPLYPVVATARAAAPGRDMRIRVGGGRREAGWPVAEGRAGGFAGEPICGDGGADGGGAAAAPPPSLVSTVMRLASISALRRNASSIFCLISAGVRRGSTLIALITPLTPLSRRTARSASSRW